ncbi:hypothetical protein [Burkholderia vietnamiensis]|uniref:hypothetical protein n=1 Tax=Burkholderia vietnamiensis TaxID=60552 RepID=UPI000841CCBA|nr:hypothetical protein [Burkholderia vietnamiensis]AOK00380.1 hypothetical protein WK23_18105 [Burkholderia vietnamiensis]HDR8924546.1 hypothetical protein [Burkholderia vietnamiensis]HDR9212323.1 hypothetical protein [Burkholderia vietnamiensis]
MKRIWQWIEVIFAVVALGIVVTFLVYAFKLHSDGAAAWVQAIGSIAAIFGAFQVGQRQADAARKQALEMDEALHRRKLEAVGAIVQGAWNDIFATSQLLTKMPPEVFLMSLKLPFYSLSESLVALAGVPLYELGSYKAVMSITGLIANLKQVDACVAKIRAEEGGLEPVAYRECVDLVTGAANIGAFHARQALTALGVTVKDPEIHSPIEFGCEKMEPGDHAVASS